MATTRFTPTVDNHTNAFRADGRIIARRSAALQAIARTDVATIATNCGLCEYRSGVTHV